MVFSASTLRLLQNPLHRVSHQSIAEESVLQTRCHARCHQLVLRNSRLYHAPTVAIITMGTPVCTPAATATVTTALAVGAIVVAVAVARHNHLLDCAQFQTAGELIGFNVCIY